mmetsp:Transcript_22635/g.36066  ORF Transcript_22635/g.36066 Transcript_22635/m.36066 type:complete len:249 (+) Transcript_22635:1338-2084(+)
MKRNAPLRFLNLYCALVRQRRTKLKREMSKWTMPSQRRKPRRILCGKMVDQGYTRVITESITNFESQSTTLIQSQKSLTVRISQTLLILISCKSLKNWRRKRMSVRGERLTNCKPTRMRNLIWTKKRRTSLEKLGERKLKLLRNIDKKRVRTARVHSKSKNPKLKRSLEKRWRSTGTMHPRWNQGVVESVQDLLPQTVRMLMPLVRNLLQQLKVLPLVREASLAADLSQLTSPRVSNLLPKRQRRTKR